MPTSARVRRWVGVLAVLGVAAYGIWMFDGPAPDQPVLWEALVGVGLTRPGHAVPFFSPSGFFYLTSRDGTRLQSWANFTFWRDALVYWSHGDNAFAIVPAAGPVRWVTLPEEARHFYIRTLCGNNSCIVASFVHYWSNHEGESNLVYRIDLPSGVVQEIPDAVTVQCSEHSNALAVQTTEGRIELRAGQSRRLLAIDPGYGWKYDFQRRLLFTFSGSGTSITVWRGAKKLWTATPHAGRLAMMLDPEHERVYSEGDVAFGVRYLECFDYQGHRRAVHLLLHPWFGTPAVVPNPRQLEAVERLPPVPD